MKITEILREWKDYSPDEGELGSKYHDLIRSNPWRARLVDTIPNTDPKAPPMDFEVEVSNPLTNAKLHFVVRPADMEKQPTGVFVDNFYVRDLQNGQTQHWVSGYGMPLHWYAVFELFNEDENFTGRKGILAKLRKYYHNLGNKNQYDVPTAPPMQGLTRLSGSQSISADDLLSVSSKANDQLKKMGIQPPKKPESGSSDTL